jgi:Protein of unknown function (DUF2917)
MFLDMKRLVLEIERRGIASVNAAAGTRIACLRGLIWITEAGAEDDIVLRAGESRMISHEGVAVVQSLREGALVEMRAPTTHDVNSPLRRWIGRHRKQWAADQAEERPATC